MFIDTHAHLNFRSFNKDLSVVITHAAKVDVEQIIIPGATIDSSKRAVAIAHKYKICYAAVGIHPHHAQEFINWEEESLEKGLLQLANKIKVVAIGEIGLDYYHYQRYPSVSNQDKQTQQKLFLLQIRIAEKMHLPVIIHCRQAYDDLLDILISTLRKSREKLKGVFHCFEGNKKHLSKVLKLGFYVSFAGNITYQENENLRLLVKLTPVNRLLLETDSPFLTPMPFRGDRNEPTNLHYIASAIAQIHKKKTIEVAEITYNNALELFSFN